MAFFDLRDLIKDWISFLNGNTINVTNSITGSGDPRKDTAVFLKGATPGHQLGLITDVLNALLKIEDISKHFAEDPEASVVRRKFRVMQAEVSLAKAGRDPSKFVRDPSGYFKLLDELQHADPKAYERVVTELKEWLAERPPFRDAK
jgi:hypothetical protein